MTDSEKLTEAAIAEWQRLNSRCAFCNIVKPSQETRAIETYLRSLSRKLMPRLLAEHKADKLEIKRLRKELTDAVNFMDIA